MTAEAAAGIAPAAPPVPAPRLRWPALTVGRAFAAIVVLGVALRLLVALQPTAHHPDEIFQYFEQAHRLLFGAGVVPWEYRYGIRSWLVALVLVPPMWLGDLLAPDTGLYLLLPRLLMIAASLGVVWGSFAIGRRVSALHALAAAGVAAIWVDLVWFAPRPMTESLAIAAILPGAALLLAPSADRRRLFAAGLLLGLGGLLRFLYLPAIGTLVLIACWRDWRRMWPPLIAGGLLVAAAGAALDLTMGQRPYGWIAENIRQNIAVGRSLEFGPSPLFGYIADLGYFWGVWLIPLLLLAYLGYRRAPALCWAAIVNFAVHTAIGHKEYRYILLTAAIVLILAAFGTVDAVRAAQRRWPARQRLIPIAAALAWVAASAQLAYAGALRAQGMSPATLLAFHDAGRVPGVCGVAVLDEFFSNGGGYSYLHRPVPLFHYDRIYEGRSLALLKARVRADAAGYNVVIAPGVPNLPLTPDYRRVSCHAAPGGNPPRCVFARPGGCASIASPFEVNRLLRRLDR